MNFKDVMDESINQTLSGVIGLVSFAGLVILGTGYVIVETWKKFGPCPKDEDNGNSH